MDLTFQNLNRDIINYRAGGKTIWQPRIGAWYDDRMFRKEELPGRYKGCSRTQLYEKLGCSDRLYQFYKSVTSETDETVTYSHRAIDELTNEYCTHTPVGTVTTVYRGNTSNGGIMPVKWCVENVNDLKVMTYVEQATTWGFDQAKYDSLMGELGHLGLPLQFFPRPNMQKLIVELAGVENTYYLLQDASDYMEAYFKAMSETQMQLAHVLAASPFEWVNYGDNLHCKILPPALFKKYVLPEYEKRGDILRRAGKFVHSHWDGDCRDYLPFVQDCFLDGVEAVTPLPQGDVTLQETKEAFGDKLLLLDGLAAILFNDTYPVGDLKQQAFDAMTLFEGQLILGISDELASNGLLERVEIVGEMVDKWNAGARSAEGVMG